MSAKKTASVKASGELISERTYTQSLAIDPAPASRAPSFIWNGKPVYRCTAGCKYERVANLDAVLKHEAEHTPTARPSRILGANGAPLMVSEGSGDEK